MGSAVLLALGVCLSVVVLVEVRIRRMDAERRRQQRNRDYEVIRRISARNRRNRR